MAIMEELLHRLERRIKSLIEQHDQLKQFNSQLNHGKSTLAREKDLLTARQEKAIEQIRLLLSRLKAIETTEAAT